MMGSIRKDCFPLVTIDKSGDGSASDAVGTLRQRRTKRLMLGLIQVNSMDWDELLLLLLLLLQFPAIVVAVVLDVEKSSLPSIPENVSHATTAADDDDECCPSSDRRSSGAWSSKSDDEEKILNVFQQVHNNTHLCSSKLSGWCLAVLNEANRSSNMEKLQEIRSCEDGQRLFSRYSAVCGDLIATIASTLR